MKRSLSITLIFCKFCLQSFSQLSGHKYEVTKKVYDDIVAAYGTNRIAPELEIRQKSYPGKKQILMYFPGTQPKIVIDEDVYDICVSLGKDSLNALASLLGHELAHHFENHNWCSNFAFLLDDKQELKQKLSKYGKEEKMKVEAEADYFGGFYGYIAGYRTLDIAGKMLDKIYSYYKLPEKIPGYPTKEDRKQIASKALKELEQYLSIFDAGEIMLCLKEYEISAACFEFIAGKFPSREIFGNAGLAKVLAAMDFMDEKTLPFALPLEMDAATRLKSGAVRGSNMSADEKERQKKILLADAIKYFDKSINSDPAYVNSYINKGCAYILLNNPDMASGIASEIILQGKGKNSQHDLSKAYSMRGVARYIKNDKENAEADLQQATTLSPIARNAFNYAVIKEMNKGMFTSLMDYVVSYFYDEKTSTYAKEKAVNPSLEKIGNESASQINLTNGSEIKLSFSTPLKLSFLINDTYKSIKIQGASLSYNILMTGQNYMGKTFRGIGQTDKIENIKLKYGEPTYTIDEVKGMYLIYRKYRIVFLLNKNNRVIKWFTYS